MRWLAEAQSIDEVRETKAIAVGYESVIREKELAFDAQLAATEIVRRCERRMGELVREGQRDGTIRKPSRVTGRGNGRVDDIPKPRDFFSGDYERTESYVMAEAPAEQFEEAITEAREEGNLSRANVVRKVKGVKPKPAERSEWHRKRRHIDSNRILTVLAQELDATTAGLDPMTTDDLDPELVESTVPEIRQPRLHPAVNPRRTTGPWGLAATAASSSARRDSRVETLRVPERRRPDGSVQGGLPGCPRHRPSTVVAPDPWTDGRDDPSC